MAGEFATFNDFMSLPVFFYHTLGVDPYESPSFKKVPSHWLYFVLLLNQANMNFTFIMEFLYVVLYFTNSEHIVEICMTICYLGFILISQLKTVSVFRQKAKLNDLVAELESIFPAAVRKEQDDYRVLYYKKRCRFIFRAFSGLFLLLVVTYSFYIYVRYLIHTWLLHVPDLEKAMPFFSISPWDWHDHWSYYIMYTLQIGGAYTATTGHISADLSIYAVNMQLVMHFDYLSKSLTEFKIKSASEPNGFVKDLASLRELILYHNKLLRCVDVD